LLLTGICYGIDTVRNNWTYFRNKANSEETKITEIEDVLNSGSEMCSLGLTGSCWNWSGCDTYFIPKQLSGLWENFVPDDTARITVVAAHYAPYKLNLSNLFSIPFNEKWASTWSFTRRWRDSGHHLFVCDICW